MIEKVTSESSFGRKSKTIDDRAEKAWQFRRKLWLEAKDEQDEVAIKEQFKNFIKEMEDQN